ncbi:hypothetical protein [Ectothiorhodospira sp. BSL-9]|uniref:hypothetical protein n=1 Tax=Ectothiorhodospira sp. BSL-9 TaxID=1442136 RepID=UPI0012E96501|nr:hypothetical protein [Ectothiorhodospira sp. BSL-9]
MTDPPIEGAAVRLVDAQGDALSTVEQTDDQGLFTLMLESDQAAQAHRIEARGGVDVRTGHVLGNLTLSAPHDGSGERAVVSPLTTLVDRRMQKMGMSREQAVGHVAERLALDESVVMADPAEDAATQRASLLITEILMALEGQDDRWERLEGVVESMPKGRLDEAASTLALDRQLPDASQTRLTKIAEQAKTLLDLDPADSNAEGMIKAQGLASLRRGLRSYFELAGEAVHDTHVHSLSEALWHGMGERGVPAGSSALLNIARYVFQVHAMPEDLLDPEAVLPLADIRHDLILRDLAAQRVIDHTIPLARGETLGMDNDARAAYFFRSDLSPAHQSERLFVGVLDDGVLDPMYRANARNLAAAGLLQEAELALQASIFQPTERALAQQQVARALRGADDLDNAVEYWRAALNTYETALREGKGISNLDGDDASFFQSLNSDLLNAGFRDDADEALLAVRQFIDSQQGEPYTTAFGRILVALRNGTSAAVEAAEEAGLSGSALNDALNAVDFFREATLGAGRQPLEGRCEAMKTMMVTTYADLYRRLGNDTGMKQAIHDFRRLATTECNLTYGATMSPRMAPIYGELGEIDTYLAWIEEHVRPINDRNADAAQDNAVLYQAVDRALAGEVHAAIEQVAAQADTAQGAITQLTQVGTGSRDAGTPHLAVLLWRQGANDEAWQVMDAAWELAMSDEYVEQRSSGRNFVDQGCRKVALILNRMDRPALARERMQACREYAESVFDTGSPTDDRLWIAKSMAEGYQQLTMSGDAELIDRFQALGGVLSDPVDRIRHLMEVALLRSSGGDPSRALDTLDEAVRQLTQVATPSSDQAAINQALDLASYIRSGSVRNSLTGSFVQVAEDIRRAITESGWADVTQQEQVNLARDRVRMLVEGDSALLGTWPGSLAMIDALAAANDRATQINSAVRWLASAREYDLARTIALDIEEVPERHRQLLNIANAMNDADDFPGTALARFDFDGDGRPDFFSPGSSEAERASSALMLDDDIDGDGVPDTEDRTPYCVGCDA